MLPEAKHDVICAACKGVKCCVNYRVGVTGGDVYRLVKGLSLDPKEFASLVRVPAEPVSPGAVYLSRAKDPFELCLKKKPSKSKQVNFKRPCIFLVEFDAFTKRCGVYPHRPMVCRIFPTTTTPFGGVDVVQRDTCAPRAWSIERVDVPVALRLHILSRIERDIYHAFLGHWNLIADAAPEDRYLSTEAFFFSLLKFYGALDEAKSACFDPPEAQSALVAGWRQAAQLHSQPWTLVNTARQEEMFTSAGPVASTFLKALHHHFADLEATSKAIAAEGRSHVNTALQAKLDRLKALMPQHPQPPAEGNQNPNT